MFQKKQLHDICNLDHHTKLPCYDFCKICVNYKQAPATVRIVEEIVAWILFIKQILCKPCFLPPCTTDNANKCCKNECSMVLAWKWTCKFTAKVLRDLVWCMWCNCRRVPESELRKSSLGQLGQTTQLLLPSVAQQNSKVKCLMVCYSALLHSDR